MKPTVKRTLSLLVSGFFLILGFITYASFIRPKIDEILRYRGILESKASFYKSQRDAVKKVNDLVMKYRGAARLEETISLSLPQKEDLSSIFAQLKSIATLSSLVIELFSVKNLPSKELVKGDLVKNIGTIELSLRLSGRYENLEEFLRSVETNIRLMDVTNLSIGRLGSEKSDVLSYNITIRTYYQE
ncbi:MAG: hypothetical protein FJY91_02520 [Candidatus Harrisonbacteria bacterium]|nr:hypothetical protein [Candidatus Harrisonbacteria bacterium]